MAEPLRIVPSVHAPDNPHANRYTPRDREACYAAWRACRSLRAVAKETDVSVSTLHAWMQADGWKARAEREDAEDSTAARIAIAARTISGTARIIARLEKELLDPGTPFNMAWVKGAEFHAGLSGFAPAKTYVPLADPGKAGGRTITAAELLALDPDELTAWTPRSDPAGESPDTA